MLRNARLAIGLALFGALGFTTVLAATFDGTPSAPLPIGTGYTDPGDGMVFDVQVHSRDNSSWYTLPAINAQHGPDCGGPPDVHTHTNTSYEGSVYQCNNHLMTAINGSAGYAAIYLTPNRIVDWSQGQATVSWDMSTQRLSTRDWVDVWVTPYADNLALPLDDWLPDLQGPPRNSIHIRMDVFNGETTFNGETFVNGSGTSLDTCWWCVIPSNTTSAVTRERFELRISQGHIWFGMPGRDLVWIDTGISVPFTSGVVQFAQHSYTPTKDNSGQPATWHWDNIEISPSTTFTIIKTDQRYTNGGVVNFASPAPANAYLRFAAIGKVKVNGVSVATQPQSVHHAEHVSSYFVPIPQGSTSATVSFAADDWYTGPYIAQDFSIWSLNAAPPPPTSTPTAIVSTPTATATAPATATPTSTRSPIPPTSTSIPTSTPTASATSTPTPTVTVTATPAIVVCRARRGTSIFGQVLYTGHIENGVCVP